MAGYNRVHIEGTLSGGAEAWSTSFACQSSIEEVTTPGDLAGWADDAFDLFNGGVGWPGDLRSMLGSTSAITKVRCYYYPSETSEAAAGGESSLTAIAGSGTVTQPNQSTLCYTLLTGLPGRSNRGRMYWPFLTATMGSGGKISTSSVTLVARATAFASMLNGITAVAPTSGLKAAVVSKTALTVTTVTAVRVGDVMDTQRRRSDTLVEATGIVPL